MARTAPIAWTCALPGAKNAATKTFARTGLTMMTALQGPPKVTILRLGVPTATVADPGDFTPNSDKLVPTVANPVTTVAVTVTMVHTPTNVGAPLPVASG